MKVGTLTFHSGLNHGGYLQAYCLAAAVAELGAEVEIINYKNPKHYEADRFNPWVYRNPLNLLFNWNKNKTFKKAFDKMALTPFSNNVEGVNWSEYDAIIVGSDIVWNYQAESLGQDPVYFGGIPESFKGKLISYAPSCGQMAWDHDVPDVINQSMARYAAVSARDANTQQFAKKYTGSENIPLVVDPTWLNESDRGRSKKVKPRGDYLLLYAYSISDAYAKAIKDYARSEGLKIIGTGYYQPFADEQFSSASPFDWVDLFASARCVVAGTFHAALYAMRETVPFAVVSQPAIDTKLKGPMTITGMHQHVLQKPADLHQVLNLTIDKTSVKKRIADARSESLAYLKAALFS